MTSDDPAGAIDMNASRPYRRFACQTCGYVYDEEQGDPAAGLAPGTRWEAVPEDWFCPDCGTPKIDFAQMSP